MPEISLKARGVSIDIPEEVVNKIQREQGLTTEQIAHRFALAVDRILDDGLPASPPFFMMS
jgi:hypothetical protein